MVRTDADADLDSLGVAPDTVARHVVDASSLDDLRCRIELGVHNGW